MKTVFEKDKIEVVIKEETIKPRVKPITLYSFGSTAMV
jgi:hypothetical protein